MMGCAMGRKGEIIVSNQPGDIIRTTSLGSCVCVIMVAQKKNLVGMANVALPDSTRNSMDVEDIPACLADTANPNLLKQLPNTATRITPK